LAFSLLVLRTMVFDHPTHNLVELFNKGPFGERQFDVQSFVNSPPNERKWAYNRSTNVGQYDRMRSFANRLASIVAIYAKIMPKIQLTKNSFPPTNPQVFSFQPPTNYPHCPQPEVFDFQTSQPLVGFPTNPQPEVGDFQPINSISTQPKVFTLSANNLKLLSSHHSATN